MNMRNNTKENHKERLILKRFDKNEDQEEFPYFTSSQWEREYVQIKTKDEIILRWMIVTKQRGCLGGV